MANFLESLDLSVRAHNACAQYLNVNTSRDFLSLEKKVVLRTPNVGARTWNEIQAKQDELKANGAAEYDPKTEAAELVHELNAILANSPDLFIDYSARRLTLFERLTNDDA